MAVTIKNPISVIKVGGGGDEPGGDAKIASYDRATGVIEGTGFGSTAGKVYMLDRLTNSYIEQSVATWTPTEITLETPLDLEHLAGTSCIMAELDDGTYSTKYVVYGEIDLEGTNVRVYYRKEDGTVGVGYPLNVNYLGFPAAVGRFTNYGEGGGEIFSTDILGVEFEKDFNVTTITNHFLRSCYNLCQPVVIPSVVTSILKNFLSDNYTFNSPVVLSDNVTTIGESFLMNNYLFNQPVILPNQLTTIGSTFMFSCRSFNQPIAFPSTLTTMQGSCLNGCNSFNSPITFSPNVKNMPSFLDNAYSFNQPIIIPEGVESLGNNILGSAKEFNSTITLPSTLKTIGNAFLGYGLGCTKFNQPLNLPNGLTSIGDSFLSYCRSFDQELILPSSLTSVGSSFMFSCTGFRHVLTVPATLTTFGNYFMYSQYQMKSLVVEGTNSPTDNYSLSSDNDNAKSYRNGITLTGSGASTWKTNLPNITNYPYRKLIDGTA